MLQRERGETFQVTMDRTQGDRYVGFDVAASPTLRRGVDGASHVGPRPVGRQHLEPGRTRSTRSRGCENDKSHPTPRPRVIGDEHGRLDRCGREGQNSRACRASAAIGPRHSVKHDSPTCGRQSPWRSEDAERYARACRNERRAPPSSATSTMLRSVRDNSFIVRRSRQRAT